MGNGELFLPVRAEIRKKIKKQAGDTVKVILYRDEEDIYIPEELQSCLDLDPDAKKSFTKLQADQQRDIIQYIYKLKNPENRAERIAELMNKGFRI